MSVLMHVGGSTVEDLSGSQRWSRACQDLRRVVLCCALPWLAGLACMVLGGCGSGEYARRMDETRTRLKAQGDIAAVLHPVATPVQDAGRAATGIEFRLPLVIDDKAKAMDGSDPAAQPPFAQLPGLAYSYEMQLGGQPVYAYFAAVPSGEKAADVFAQEVQTALSAAFSSAAWIDTDLKTPDGGSVKLKLLSVTGPQKFGQDVQDGRFDLYLVSSGTHHVLIGWRAPEASGGGFFDNAACAMGSVQGKI